MLLKYSSSRESRGKRQRDAVGQPLTHIDRQTLDSKEKQSFPSAFPARETPDETGVEGVRSTEELKSAQSQVLTF